MEKLLIKNTVLAGMPLNWEEEQEKFFAAKFKYEPQFEYAKNVNGYTGEPSFKYLDQATKIIDSFLKTYGSESKYLECFGKLYTDQEGVAEHINNYLADLGPEVKASAKLNFTSKNMAGASISYDNGSKFIKINYKLPIRYRETRITGLLHHEIGTHFIRRYNEVQQVWHNKREMYGLKSTL